MTDVAIQRSPEEIEDLKRQWRADPIWDIEDTEGFEAHRDELHDYRKEQEARWKAERQQRLAVKAETLGCPGNTALAAYVEGLEEKIADLSRRLDTIEGQ